MNDRIFWDSNLWIYLFARSQDPREQRKKVHLDAMLRQAPHLVSSAQVLNETSNALLRKFAFSDADVRASVGHILGMTENVPLTKATTLRALDLRARHSLGWYDSLIIASALDAGCRTLFSEDLQHGLVVEKQLTIENPFRNF